MARRLFSDFFVYAADRDVHSPSVWPAGMTCMVGSSRLDQMLGMKSFFTSEMRFLRCHRNWDGSQSPTSSLRSCQVCLGEPHSGAACLTALASIGQPTGIDTHICDSGKEWRVQRAHNKQRYPGYLCSSHHSESSLSGVVCPR